MSKLLLLLPIILFASPAKAETKEKAADAEKKICRVERDTSSRIISRKVCLTRTQWDERDRQLRDDIHNASKNRVSLGANN